MVHSHDVGKSGAPGPGRHCNPARGMRGGRPWLPLVHGDMTPGVAF